MGDMEGGELPFAALGMNVRNAHQRHLQSLVCYEG